MKKIIVNDNKSSERSVPSLYNIKPTLCNVWPILMKHRLRDIDFIALYGNSYKSSMNVSHMVYRVAAHGPSMSPSHTIDDSESYNYDYALCVTEDYVYVYNNPHICIYDINTTKLITRHTLFFDMRDIFVRIIVRETYIFILTHNYSQLHIYTYDGCTFDKINKTCVFVSDDTYMIIKANFAITDKYIYIHCVTQKKTGDILTSHNIRIFKRDSYFIV